MPSVRSTNSDDEDSDTYEDSEELKPPSSAPNEDLAFDEEHSNIILTGPGKRTPVFQFRADCLVNRDASVRQVGEKYHLSFILTRGDCKIVRTIFHAHGFHESHPNSPDFNLMWTSSQVKPYVLRSLTEFQRINHFPRSYEITRKDRLFKNVQRMQQIKGVKHFDIVPSSFVLPGEFQEFCAAFLKDKGPYIVKPIALSRGRGIFLCNHPEQIHLDEQLIVCKYIANPLLIDGFKFDIRLYVAVTSYDPLMVYLYEEGLARFATMKYDANPKAIRHQCMHLTNYSINKRNENFVHNDDAEVEDYGNKWSLGALLRYLKSQGKDVTALMMRIEDVVIKALLSVELPISTACKMFQPHRGNCFELYGFDIILDEALRPWLLEVNLSPSLACDAPIDFKIKSHMVCDLLTLVGLPCHDPVLRVPHQARRNQRSTPPRPHSSGPHSMGPTSRPPTGAKPGVKRGQNGGSVLTADEVKMIRRAKEEYARRGGWTRIFPTKDTWDIYASFFQSVNSSNFLLHSKLFGDSSTPASSTTSSASNSSKSSASRPVSSNNSALNNPTAVVSKTKVPLHSLSLSSLSLALSSSAEHHRRVAAVYSATQDRVAFYQRRLGAQPTLTRSRSLPARRRPPELSESVAAVVDPTRSVFRGNLLQADSDRASDSEPDEPVGAARSEETAMRRSASVDRGLEAFGRKEEEEVGHRSEEEINNMEVVPADLLKKGGEMSKLQARYTFGAYLSRVQQRLMLESRVTQRLSADESRQACEQIDLVLRFLRRASDNLHQEFRVQIPSRKLPLSQRKRILSKMLSDFISIYAKETEHMRLQLRDFSKESGLPEADFGDFLRLASESELESILTTYTHANKSAGIFINAHAPAKEAPRLQRTASMDSGVFIRDDPAESGDQTISLSRQSLHNAALAYTAKLGRPSSALTLRSSSAVASGRPVPRHRPSSASLARQEQRVPLVETYDEAAINAALHKLAVKQQARQYAATKVSSVLRQSTSAYQHRQYQSDGPADSSSDLAATGDTYVPQTRVRRSSAADLQRRVSADLSERLRAEYATRPVSRGRELATSQSLLHQFRQSKALLEASRAKHDAMLAQVSAGPSATAATPVKRPKPPAGPKPSQASRSAVIKLNTGLQQPSPPMLKLTFASHTNPRY